jgi:hypothetical protein
MPAIVKSFTNIKIILESLPRANAKSTTHFFFLRARQFWSYIERLILSNFEVLSKLGCELASSIFEALHNVADPFISPFCNAVEKAFSVSRISNPRLIQEVISWLRSGS